MGRRLANGAQNSSTSSSAALAAAANAPAQRGAGRSRAAVAGGTGAAAAVLAGGLLLTILLLILRRRRARSRRTTPAADGGAVVPPPPLRRFRYGELKRATGGFSEANKLGQGGFGSVFKGRLRGGKMVAVKRLDTASLQGEREFTNELFIVSKIMSTAAASSAGGAAAATPSPPPSVVALLGYCDSKRKLLVYEYMENRSLQEALFSSGDGRRGAVLLEWGKRVGILLDVARALSFLHSKCEPPVIHGDVKPSNVLLDTAFAAKLADFGLARLKSMGDEGDEAAAGEDLPPGDQQSSSSAAVVVKIPEASESQPPSMSQSPVAPRMEEEDDWMSKASGYEGTEADTWSKLSPSDVDWRSEMSLDDRSGGGVGDSGRRRNRSRRIGFWKKKKPATPDEEAASVGGGDWWGGGGGDGGGGGGGGIKGYLADWKRGRSRTRGSATTTGTATDTATTQKKKQARSGSLEWWAECEDDGNLTGGIKSEQKRKQQLSQQLQRQESFSMPLSESSREWWRIGGGKSGVGGGSQESFTFYHHPNHSGEMVKSNSGDGGRRRVRTRSRDWWSGEMQRGREWWSGEIGRSTRIKSVPSESLSGDLSAPPGQQQQQKQRPRRRRRRSLSREWWSGELGTTMSSTPSMRGTVCYVAPELGAAEASEKADVYSFGVLCLVVVAGRRPLQVIAAPLSEYERANLVSWARAAARAGRLLDIVDPLLRGEYDHQQAAGIVSLALQCLQRSPQLRPSMANAARVLAGETEAPQPPLEFSPSPPAKKKSSSSSRSKAPQQKPPAEISLNAGRAIEPIDG